MIILPAIDLLEGKVVRLYQGDYAKATRYALDPCEVARSYKDAGATWLHVVDLDAAKRGDRTNFGIVEKLAGLGLKVEYGGGVRNMETLTDVIGAGVERAVIGSAAVKDPEFLKAAAKAYANHVAAGADARDGVISIHGWTESSGITLLSFAKSAKDAGVQTLVCTDVAKDGALGGTNLRLYEELLPLGLSVIASGGVTFESEIEALAKLGVSGAIVGRALYEGQLDLKRAIQIAGGAAAC